MSNPIALNIARLRAEKGLTQRELAEMAGLSWSQISRYESGVVRPRLGSLLRLAEALGVQQKDLESITPVDSHPAKFPERISNGLDHALSILGDEEREELEREARALGVSPKDAFFEKAITNLAKAFAQDLLNGNRDGANNWKVMGILFGVDPSDPRYEKALYDAVEESKRADDK